MIEMVKKHQFSFPHDKKTTLRRGGEKREIPSLPKGHIAASRCGVSYDWTAEWESFQSFKREEIMEEEIRDILIGNGVRLDELDAVMMGYETKFETLEAEVAKPKKVRPIWWCPLCQSSQTYYKSRTNTQKCFKCGYEWVRQDLEPESKSS